MEFDANTGNFNITASFIGHMYGIYADMPMTYIAIAPFMLNGKEYWNEQIKNGKFVFRDINGNPQSKMITIPDLRLKLAEISINEEAISAAAEGEECKGIYNERIEKIGSLMETYPLMDWYECSGSSYIYKIFPINGDVEYEEVKTRISDYVTAVSGYDETYGKTLCSEIKTIKDYVTSGINATVFAFHNTNGDINSYSHNTDKTAKIGDLKTPKRNAHYLFNEQVSSYEDVLEYIEKNRSGLTEFNLVVIDAQTPNVSSVFLESLKNEHKYIAEQKIKDEEYFKEKENSIIEKVLGFRPSVRNIYELIFAHMETFMNCFYSSTKEIKNQLDFIKEKRSKKYYNINDGDTDTENEKIKTSNGSVIERESNDRSHYLPPYAAYYKEVYNLGETKKMLRWPGELLRGEELEEVNFVTELLAAAEMYDDNFTQVERTIELMNSGGTVNDNVYSKGDSPSTNIIKYIPLTTYDYIYKDNLNNPYESVVDKVYRGTEDIESEILGIFASRMYYYQLVNGDKPNQMAKVGQLEAINLFKAVRDKFSKNFISFIKKYANVYTESKTSSEECLGELTSVKDTEVTSAWHTTNEPNLNKSLFSNKGNNVKYSYHKGVKYDDVILNGEKEGYVGSSLVDNEITDKSYKAKNDTNYNFFPLKFYDFKSLKKKYVYDKDLINDSDFIALNYDEYIYSAEDNKVGTFSIFETRNYVENVINCIDKEIDEAKKSESYGDRGSSEYGKLRLNTGDFKFLRDNVVSIKKSGLIDDIYDPQAFIDEEGDVPSLKKIENAIENGEEIKKYYISKPTSLIDGDVLFIHPFYKAQHNIYAKACLFLQSLYFGERKPWDIDFVSRNQYQMKSQILLEGSFYWMSENIDKFVNTCTTLDGGVVVYKLPDGKQWFKQKNSTSIKFIEENKPYAYENWKEPQNCTPSRRKVLKKYFENWVNNSEFGKGFITNETLLNNANFYLPSRRFFKNGLNVINLVLSDKQSDDAIKARKLQDFLKDLYFGVVLTMDLYNSNNGIIKTECNKKSLSKAFYGFFRQLYNMYGEAAKDLKKDSSEFNRKLRESESNNPFKSVDIKLSTYLTLKSLYDKWLSNPHKGPENTWVLSKDKNTDSDFDSFVYADSYYHDIGYQMLVNITKVSSWLSNCMPSSNLTTGEGQMGYYGKSVFDFIKEVAQDCNAMLMTLPVKFGLQDNKDIEKLFKPLSIYDDWDDDSSTFVFMYVYKLSEHLDNSSSSKSDMNGWSENGDGLDLTDDEIVGKVLSDDGYTIPAFAVTYAKQNQSIFKSVRLGNQTLGTTEVGLAATYDIASKASESPRETTLYGQDLYKVYSNYSYECSVEMMGNLQITPMMYFQLNNIPLWRGAYMIYNVSHELTAGNVTTTFKGMRINRCAIPLADSKSITIKEGDSKGNNNGDNNVTNSQNENQVGHSNKNSNNNIIGDSSTPLRDVKDFNDSNVTNKKPIICVTPAHGPETQKSYEWGWSTKVVDTIVKKLSAQKYYDGTSYNVQRCNKNGKNSGKNGYNMRETEAIIKRYGSDKVISVVPHWNGGKGKYHLVLVDKASNGVRDDSFKLAECLQTEFVTVKDKVSKLTTQKPPEHMLDGKCRITNLGGNCTDAAPQLACACVLTENWFADYSMGGFLWYNDNYAEMINGMYQTGRGWLMSEKGVEIIAQAHVDGIKRYINSL